MQFRIIGCERQTGDAVDIVVEERSMPGAEARANKMGVMVESIDVVPPQASNRKVGWRAAVAIGLAVGVTATAIVAGLLYRAEDARRSEKLARIRAMRTACEGLYTTDELLSMMGLLRDIAALNEGTPQELVQMGAGHCWRADDTEACLDCAFKIVETVYGPYESWPEG